MVIYRHSKGNSPNKKEVKTMKKLYTNKARKSEIERITQLINTIATTPGNVIGYLDARAIIEILADRKDDLLKEIEVHKED